MDEQAERDLASQVLNAFLERVAAKPNFIARVRRWLHL